MGRLRLANLINIHAVQKMVDASFRSTGIPVGVIDAVDETILAGAGWQEICLRFHRVHPESQSRCRESDSGIKDRLTNGKPSAHKCRNGLWDIGIPIVVSGQHLASVFLGQFFYADEIVDRDFFIRQAEKYGYDRTEYLAALDNVPVLRREIVENTIACNQAFANLLTELAEQSLANILAEKTLRENHERLSILFEKAADAIYVAKVDGQLVHVNEQACLATGYTEEELLQQHVLDIDAEIRDSGAFASFAKTLVTGQPVTFESRHRRKDGSIYPVEVKAALLQTDGEQHILGIARDIAGRKRAEQEVYENEQRYKKAQRMGRVGNWEYDLVQQRFWASEEARRIFGFAPDSMRYTTDEVENCIPERQRVHQALIDLIENNSPYNIEYEIIPEGGSARRIIKSIAERIDDEQGNPQKIAGVIQDITERKQMEARLQHAQKMEAVGNLAGGIAHDFNNILAPIIGFSELLLARLPDTDFAAESARRILNAGQRGSDLVKQILAFSRRSEQRMIPVQIQPILGEVIKLSRSTIPTNIEISHTIQADCGPVLADPTQLHQIAMNLVTNAYQAIDSTEGLITINLKEMAIDMEPEGHIALRPGRYAVLSVTDSGCGIDPKVLGSIFEPYFTTKEQGKGTGLGLAVVYGIVKEYQGDIRVYSELGKGTNITVLLPVTESRPDQTQVETIERYPQGTERLLIVDDEEAIVEFESLMLARLGYQTTSSTGSLEALATFAEAPETFDLVLTDMSMPHMTGDQLLREIHAIRPDIPVIICTGFSERMQKENAAAMDVKAFLMKPVSISELAMAIRNALDDPT